MIREFPFTDVVKDVSGGNQKIKRSDYSTSGNIPVIDQGKSRVGGYTDDQRYLFNASPLPVVIFGDHTCCVKHAAEPFAMGADGVKVLKPSNQCDSKYLYHYLKQVRLTDGGYDRHYKYLKRIKIPLPFKNGKPDLDEQKRIAAVLDKADVIRRKRRQALQLTDDFLRSLFLNMFGDPVTNPKEWERKLLGEVTTIDAPMVDPRREEYQALLHYGPDRIEKQTGKLLPAKTASEDGLISGKFLCHPGEILYSKIRPNLNKVALVKEKCLCSADVYPVKPMEGIITKEYLWVLLSSHAFLDYVGGFSRRANIPKLNRKQFAGYDAPIPPYELQLEFSKKLQRLDDLKSKLENEREEQLFASLQQRAFNGDL